MKNNYTRSNRSYRTDLPGPCTIRFCCFAKLSVWPRPSPTACLASCTAIIVEKNSANLRSSSARPESRRNRRLSSPVFPVPPRRTSAPSYFYFIESPSGTTLRNRRTPPGRYAFRTKVNTVKCALLL